VYVPIDKVKELDQARRLLASTINLALRVSEARIKAETAFIAVEQIADDDSPQAGVGQWRDLVRKLEEIASFRVWLSNDSGLPEPLLLSVRSSHQAREGADAKAQQVVRLLKPLGVSQLEASQIYAVSDAIRELRQSLNECADACGSESQANVERIGRRAESMLEQFESQREPSGQPTAEKRHGPPQGEVPPVPPSVASDRKLTVLNDDSQAGQQSEKEW
jgi:hypothetical protein